MAKKVFDDFSDLDLSEDEGMATIGSRVARLRKMKKWSQSELAKKLGEARSQITRLESGETKNMNSDLIVKLAKIFGVSTDYLLCVTDHMTARYTNVERLGLSEDAAKKLMSGAIDRDVLNRLLEHKDFGPLCEQMRYYYDDTFTEGYIGRNEILDLGIDSLRQYAQEHPDKRGNIRDDMMFLNTQKASADEINTEKISKGFMKILKDIRTELREKKPTTPTATSEAIDIIQASIADKPRDQLTPDVISAGVMAVLDSKVKLEPGPRRMIERFVRWFMRVFGGKRKNNEHRRFQAYQELEEELDKAEK